MTRFNDKDSKLTIAVDGKAQGGGFKFLPWLADHVMRSEIAKRDPFINPFSKFPSCEIMWVRPSWQA